MKKECKDYLVALEAYTYGCSKPCLTSRVTIAESQNDAIEKVTKELFYQHAEVYMTETMAVTEIENLEGFRFVRTRESFEDEN